MLCIKDLQTHIFYSKFHLFTVVVLYHNLCQIFHIFPVVIIQCGQFTKKSENKNGKM